MTDRARPRTQAPGIGQTAKRHDIDDPISRVAPLAGSDLQHGDIQQLEAGLQAQPIQRKPGPAPSSATNSGGVPRAAAPDPVALAIQRKGGQQNLIPSQDQEQRMHTKWLPLLEQFATTPGASGLLTKAYVGALTRAVSGGAGQGGVLIDRNNLNQRIEDI